MKFVYSIILTAFIFMVHPFTSDAQASGQQIHQFMKEIYPEDNPGAAVLVMQDGKIIINEGFGLADLKQKTEITPNTNFRMASVSKQFTAMCILLLAHRHKLLLSDPITKYLSGMPSFANGITIRHLLTHSSGLQDYESLISSGRTAQVTDADVLDLIRHSDSLYFVPGTQFRYSNTGFCLLTQIVEAISGLPYSEFIRKNIFEPLGMSHTLMYDKNVPISQRAYGYHPENGQFSPADQSITSATLGDGSVYTSTNDYLKWISALWNQELFAFDKETNPLLPHMPISLQLEYGYGWFTTLEADGTRSDFHSGESTGFHNIVYQNPEKKTLVIIFSNSDDDRISEAFDKIANVLNIHLRLSSRNISLFHFLSNIYD